MRNITLLILILWSFNANASPIVYGTTYAPNGQVTSANLNGNFTNVSSVVNGGLDNTNANTTQGYRFYQTVATLPSPGNQGATYFLTSDDTLNFDTGAAFNKSVSLNNPVNGDIIYYNSGWNALAKGSNGQYLTLSTGIPAWSSATASNLSISGQAAGDLVYYDGANWVRLPKSATSGTVLQTGTTPSYVNSLSSVSDYGTSSTTSSSVQGTALKIAYGTASMSGGNVTISNLPFTSQTSFHCTCSRNVNSATSQAVNCFQGSASTMKIQDGLGGSDPVNWICDGT